MLLVKYFSWKLAFAWLAFSAATLGKTPLKLFAIAPRHQKEKWKHEICFCRLQSRQSRKARLRQKQISSGSEGRFKSCPLFSIPTLSTSMKVFLLSFDVSFTFYNELIPFSVFENKEKMVLVMEIAAGGELYDYLSERKTLEEKEARRVFRQIATAVFYCHKVSCSSLVPLIP